MLDCLRVPCCKGELKALNKHLPGVPGRGLLPAVMRRLVVELWGRGFAWSMLAMACEAEALQW